MFNKYKQKKHICLQGNIFLVIFESDLYYLDTNIVLLVFVLLANIDDYNI